MSRSPDSTIVSQELQSLIADLAGRIGEEVARVVSARVERERGELRREIVERFHQAARRFRQCETEEGLYPLLLDACSPFCERVMVVAVSGQELRLVGARGVAGLDERTMPLAAAPAIRAVVETAETVVALAAPGELSEAIASRLGQGGKAYLFPVLRHGRVAAVVCASGEEVDGAALELIASLAGVALEARKGAGGPKELVAIAGVAEAPAAKPPRPAWAELPREEQQIHLRAQRFARVRVAEMRLHKGEAVRAGREARDLYGSLKTEIDAAREAFRLQYIAACPSMVDYLHLELIHSLAHDDEALLGPDYPGPLV